MIFCRLGLLDDDHQQIGCVVGGRSNIWPR